MIEEIREFMEPIIGFFEMIIDFIINLFQDIVYMVELTAETVAQLPHLFSWLPAEVLTILLAIFSIAVIYLILGRQ